MRFAWLLVTILMLSTSAAWAGNATVAASAPSVSPADRAVPQKKESGEAAESVVKIFKTLQQSLNGPRRRAEHGRPTGAEKASAGASSGASSSSEEARRSGERDGSAVVAAGVPDVLHVWPDVKSYIPVSKIDVNRFVCERGKVVGEIYSNDKGLVVQRAGDSIYLRIAPKTFAFDHPFEFFVVCGEKEKRWTYTMILTPERISTRTAVLHAGSGSKEGGWFVGKTRTDAIVDVVKAAFSEKWPEDFEVHRVFQPVRGLLSGARVVKYLVVDAGRWVADVYVIDALRNLHLRDEDFVGEDTVAVAVFDPFIKRGTFGKVVVVREKSAVLR